MAISRVLSLRAPIFVSCGHISKRYESSSSIGCIHRSVTLSFSIKPNNIGMITQQRALTTSSSKLSIRLKYDDGIDLNNQTVEINPIEHIRRCTLYKDIDIGSYYKSICPEVRTLGDVLDYGQAVSKDGPCLGFVQPDNNTEPIRWLSYSKVSEQARIIGSHLWAETKLIPSDSKLAIMSANRPEYPIFTYSCYMYGFIVVNLFTSYDSKTILDLLRRTQTQVLVVDNLARIRSVERQLIEMEEIKEIIVMDEISDGEHKKIRSLSSILKTINPINIRPRPTLDSNSVATFLLTSGTTGEPKIAMITHENFMAGMKSTIDREKRADILCNPSDRHCSFLPVAHLYEQAALLLMFINGSRIVCCPSPDKLVEYYAIVKPTRIFMVPRVLNKIYNKVMGEVDKSNVKRYLVEKALRQEKSSFFSRIIFRKVKQLFGGEVSTMLSASAPISRDVLRFFRIALDVPIYEIFGQTESTGVNVTTHVIDTSCGTVGTPVCTVEVKLVDVPGTNYRSDNGQGEICIRGPSIFKGYYADEAKTREIIDEGGWLHTGDVGEWSENGTLRLIDRSKHIFKLSQGQYVAPERLEEVYLRSRWISQIFIDGRSIQATVVAVVVPDEEYAKKNFTSTTRKSLEELCTDDEFKQLIMTDLLRIAKENKLKYFETVSNIYLHHEPFSQQNGLITSTFKTRRVMARKYFQKIIDSLYSANETNNEQKTKK
ncbi:unnamed protein product [Rotaria magnacalcarata]|uniref:long-chain-fatty-acid--CoA ligase n=1 Tax=Rotaria magnacalcarata TaxID=392030 RepID=A0A816B2F3_9BILA|nr:unnamed protein product [Rotaria magnacalcarata]